MNDEGVARTDFFRSLWLGMRHYLANDIFSAALSLVGILIFTRMLSPEEYGNYALTLALGAFGLTFSVEWVQSSLLRFIPVREIPRNRAAASAAVLHATLLGLAAFTILLAPVVIASQNPRVRGILILGWFYTLCGAPFMVGTSILQARFQSALYLRFRTGFSVLRVILAILFLVAVSRSWVSLLSGSLAAFLALVFPLGFYLGVPGQLCSTRARVELRSILRFGLPLLGWFLANQFLNLSDRFLIEFFMGSDSVGVYSVSYALVAGVSSVALQPPLAAAYPLLARSFGRDGSVETGARLGHLLDRVLLVLPPLLAGIAIFGNELLDLLVAPTYATSPLLLAIIALGIVFWQGSLYLQKALELELRTRLLLIFAGVSALTNLVLNLLLIPRIGILGAAYATLLAYCLYATLLISWVRSRTSIGLDMRTAFSALLGLAFFITAGLLPRLFMRGMEPWTHLLVGAPAAVAAYLLVLRLRGEFRGWRGEA